MTTNVSDQEAQRFNILTLKEKGQWKDYLKSFPEEWQDVYFLPEYYELYETDHVKAECFVYTDNENVLLYPYLKTSINSIVNFDLNEQYYDIEGAYGYNGIIANCKDQEFLDGFTKEFSQYCRNNNIIVEFMRINPIYQDDLVNHNLRLKKTNKNIIVDLTLTEEDIWSKSYEHCIRKNVKTARRNNLVVESYWGHEIDESHLDNFIDIYHHTLDRNDSHNVYYFKKDFFERVCRLLGHNSLFFFAMFKKDVISCELVLLGGENAYSFLGGTIVEKRSVRPNNYLKHEIIGMLKKNGIKRYCLGGGQKINDGIYRYKKSFAKNGDVDFFIGEQVHNREIYDTICQGWEKQFPEKEDHFRNFILKYKY